MPVPVRSGHARGRRHDAGVARYASGVRIHAANSRQALFDAGVFRVANNAATLIRARIRRYLKSVSGDSDVAIRAFELRRKQHYLKPCVRRTRRGVTHVTCANPLLAAALWLCAGAPDPRERYVYDAKPPSYLGFSDMGFRYAVRRVRCTLGGCQQRRAERADLAVSRGALEMTGHA